MNTATARPPLSLEALENVVDLYIRVSTMEQAEEGFSVGEQEARLRAYCSAYNFTIHAVHVDPGYSGATLERPGIKNVIRDVKAGTCRKVIVWKLDRLSRSQKDTLILLEDVFAAHSCGFISLMESFDTGTPFGRCIVGILAAFAQMERENIKSRTMMGKQARIRQGHFHGSHAPVGYKFCLDQSGQPISNDIFVDDYEAKLTKEVFSRYLSGESISSISKIMLERYGDSVYDWGHNTAIRRILSNPVYMGKVRVGKELYNGVHEALVSEADWYAASALLAHNKELIKRSYSFKTSKGNIADNILTGLLFCGDCGARMYARKVSRNKKKYICHSVARTAPAMIKSDHCSNRLHPYTVEELDAIVIGEIKKLSLDQGYFNQMIERSDKVSENDMALCQERKKNLDKQTERLLNLYQIGVVQLPDIQHRLSELQEEKSKLQAQLDAYRENSDSLKSRSRNAILSFPDALERGSREEIHNIIHTLIDKVEVLNADVTIYWSFC